MCVAERAVLVGQNLQRQPRVQLGIVATRVLELPILVMLHQLMVRIPRKRERAARVCRSSVVSTVEDLDRLPPNAVHRSG